MPDIQLFYRIDVVRRTTGKLSQMLSSYVGKMIDKGDISKITHLLKRTCGAPHFDLTDYHVITDTMEGTVLSEMDVNRLAQYVAGVTALPGGHMNLKPRWVFYDKDVVVPFMVKRMRTEGEGFKVQLLAVGDKMNGWSTNAVWTRRQVNRYAHFMGFSFGVYQVASPYDIIDMVGVFGVASGSNRVACKILDGYECSAVTAKNRQLIKQKRFGQCPDDKTSPCHLCERYKDGCYRE
jgi:hypothetical protein